MDNSFFKTDRFNNDRRLFFIGTSFNNSEMQLQQTLSKTTVCNCITVENSNCKNNKKRMMNLLKSNKIMKN